MKRSAKLPFAVLSCPPSRDRSNRVFSDSALVVNTVNGDWNLQPEHLKDLCAKAVSSSRSSQIPVILGSSGNEPRSGRTCKQSARPRPLTPGAAGSLPRPAAAGSAPSSGYTTMSSSACRRESPGWSTASSSIVQGAVPAAYLEMIDRWGHVSQGPRRYSVTAFDAGLEPAGARRHAGNEARSRHWPV